MGLQPRSDVVRLASSTIRETGHPVLFVHGFAHNRHVWNSLVEGMHESLRPLLIDLRGHGDSGWSAQCGYAPADYARDFPAFLDGEKLDRVILVGHSLGGLSCALFAAQNPERVSGLVLVDTGPDLSVAALGRIASETGSGPQSFESVRAYSDWLIDLIPLADRRALLAFCEKSLVSRLDNRFELKIDPAALAPGSDEMSWSKISSEVHRALRIIDCPSLVVRGGLSALLSAERAESLVNDDLQNGQLVTLSKAGHAVMLEDAPGLKVAIESFALEVSAEQL